MTTLTTPDSLAIWTNADPNSLPTASAAMMTSVQDALSKRERFSFTWANATERGAQEGMVDGSLGYQSDTKTNYVFTDGAWELTTPHTEWTFTSPFIPTTTVATVGALILDTGSSTSTSQADSPSSGAIRIANPGIYALSSTMGTTNTVAFISRAFVELSFNNDVTNREEIFYRASIVVGEDRGTVAVPNLLTFAADKIVYLRVYHQNPEGVYMYGRVRLTRIG